MQTLESNSLAVCLAILVRGSDLHKHWGVTHSLGAYSVILVSHSDMLKHQGATHILKTCSVILVNGSNLLKQWSATYNLDVYSTILISCYNLLKHWRITHSLCNVRPFLSVVWSAKKMERDSLPRSMFSSCHWSDLLNDWRRTHSLKMCSVIFVSGYDLLKAGEQLTCCKHVQ